MRILKLSAFVESIPSRLSRSVVAVAMCCVSIASLSGWAAGQQSSPGNNNDKFSLSGQVVNSVTGESIGHALVRINSFPPRTAFTDGEGNFQVDGLPAGRVSVSAQKPGYTSEQDAPVHSPTWISIGSGTSTVVIKLIPQSSIYGRITDAAGLPIEHMPLRLKSFDIQQGRKHWEAHGMVETDEDGKFRFPNLMSGTYYLAAGPSNIETQLLAGSEKPKTGYPFVYYPGVPDFNSASPIQVSAGQPVQADFSVSAVPVYQVSGIVSGFLPDEGVGIQVLNSSGDDLPFSSQFSMENGSVHIESVPAGSYIVRAFAQGAQALRAEAKVNVATNVDNLRLALAPAVSIPIVARLDSRAGQTTGRWSADRPPISVRLVPIQPMASEVTPTFARQNGTASHQVLQNVDAGSYAVELDPQAPWYVQSASCGQTNLLYDDLYVPAGGQGSPMEIVLRDDSATLSGTVRSSDAVPQATVIVLPQPAIKSAPKIRQVSGGSFSISGLAPGEYMVFAFDDVGGLEYANPDVLQGYASQAAHITLTSNQTASVNVDLIRLGKGQ